MGPRGHFMGTERPAGVCLGPASHSPAALRGSCCVGARRLSWRGRRTLGSQRPRAARAEAALREGAAGRPGCPGPVGR